MNRIKRIPFEEQRIQCIGNKAAYFLYCKCGEKHLLCKTHDGMCIAHKCREQRIIKTPQENGTKFIDDDIDVEKEREAACES